jgi:hypothetical protein
MGCAVNGPGEARRADIGIAGGNGEGLIFRKGEIIRKVNEEDLVEELIKEVNQITNAEIVNKNQHMIKNNNEQSGGNLMKQYILSLNCGSSSLKFNLFEKRKEHNFYHPISVE